MARGTQHRKRRPTANVRVSAATAAPKRPKRAAYEEQLFFGRLRVHAKWMFALLAGVFTLTFVFLGVGSGSTGISSVLQNFFTGSTAGGSSLSALQKKTVDHPKNAQAWLNYANKLQADSQLDNAATALTTYDTLETKHSEALQQGLLQLAGIYLQRATDWQTLYTNSQARNTAIAPTGVLTPSTSSPLGKAIDSLTSPLTSAVAAQGSTDTQNEYSTVLSYLGKRLDIYKQLEKLNPQDASTQINLAQAATDDQDTATAIVAYKAFLKLAPTDSEAPSARSALKQLEAQAKSSAATTTTPAATTTTTGKGKTKTTTVKTSTSKTSTVNVP